MREGVRHSPAAIGIITRSSGPLARMFMASAHRPPHTRQEMVERLHLPFEVLSDAEFRLTEALRLPTFEAGGMRLLKRLTLLVRANRIERCFLIRVFPPDADAGRVLTWLGEQSV